MTALPDFILDALPKPIGYRHDFRDSVIRLKQALDTRMHVSFRHDEDMNYNAGQSLKYSLRGKGKGLQKHYAVDLSFCISSKAPLFAVHCYDATRTDGPCIAQEQLPDAARAWIDRARAVLVDAGLTEVEHRYFREPAPGCVTQLDGLPATVFESLFAELV